MHDPYNGYTIAYILTSSWLEDHVFSLLFDRLEENRRQVALAEAREDDLQVQVQPMLNMLEQTHPEVFLGCKTTPTVTERCDWRNKFPTELTTMSFPLFSNLCATLMAAAAPDEIPTRNKSPRKHLKRWSIGYTDILEQSSVNSEGIWAHQQPFFQRELFCHANGFVTRNLAEWNARNHSGQWGNQIPSICWSLCQGVDRWLSQNFGVGKQFVRWTVYSMETWLWEEEVVYVLICRSSYLYAVCLIASFAANTAFPYLQKMKKYTESFPYDQWIVPRNWV